MSSRFSSRPAAFRDMMSTVFYRIIRAASAMLLIVGVSPVRCSGQPAVNPSPPPNPYGNVPAIFPSIGLPIPCVNPATFGGGYSLPFGDGMQSRATFRYVDMSDAGFHVDPYTTHSIDGSRIPASAISNSPDQYRNQAITAFAAGQYREAMRFVMHAVLENPEDFALRFWLSQCNVADGDYLSAMKELRFALEHVPSEHWLGGLESVRSLYGADRESYLRQVMDLEIACREEGAEGWMHLLLAFHRLDSLNSAATIATAMKASELDPEMRPIANRFIELVRGNASLPKRGGETFLPANGDPEEMELLPLPAR
jgi:tetratricopeptide (TPR) repeat protein